MNYALERDLKAIFLLAAETKAAERQIERMRVFYEEIDREHVHKLKLEEKKAKEDKALKEALATTAQLAAFNEHLDAYDTATVHALMENGEALDHVSDSLRQVEENAFTLPDGRRVFKTTDGKRVFDEHGTAVTNDTINPDVIGERYPVWEKFRDLNAEKGKLESERHDLLAFQGRVDVARDKAHGGELSKNDLDELEADLKANAPLNVGQHLKQVGPVELMQQPLLAMSSGIEVALVSAPKPRLIQDLALR